MPEYTCPSIDYREVSERPRKFIVLNAWTVQGIVKELISAAFKNTDPEDLGYSFKSNNAGDCDNIFVDIGYQGDLSAQGKLPQVYVRRGPEQQIAPHMGQYHRVDAQESRNDRFYINNLTLYIDVFAMKVVQQQEQIQGFIQQSLRDFEQQIKSDFLLRRFRLGTIAQPGLQARQPPDTYVISMQLDIQYDYNTRVKGDDLKLKTVSSEVFDALCQPFE